MARPFLLLTILNDAGSLHAIPPGADAEISGHAPLVAELVGHAIGVFTNLAADDPEAQARIWAFLQGLQHAGWTLGSNVRSDYRWGTTDDARYDQHADEVGAPRPEPPRCVPGDLLD